MKGRKPGLKSMIWNKRKKFIFRQREREKERERNINVWLPFVSSLLGT